MGARVRLVVRAASLVGFALTGWSINVRWGSNEAVRGGPPIRWEQIAVGAALLSALAALAVWLATRPGVARSRPWLRGAACVLALAVAFIAFYLRRQAEQLGIGDLLNGPGWSWLLAGAGISLAAAAGSFAAGGAPPRRAATGQRAQRKRRPRRA